MKPKLTRWFRPHQKPAREGRYQAQDHTMHCNCCWIELEWRGGEWFSDLLTPGRYRTHFWQHSLKRWRGLAERPTTNSSPLPSTK